MNEHVVNLIAQIETEMKKLSLWQNSAPALENFSSDQPFFMDKMAPQEWLQWVLLPNLQYLMEQSIPLHGFLISPYFEVVWQHRQQEYALLFKLIQQLDEYFEASSK